MSKPSLVPTKKEFGNSRDFIHKLVEGRKRFRWRPALCSCGHPKCIYSRQYKQWDGDCPLPIKRLKELDK